MMPIFSARLEARDPARNCWRSYRVEAGQDLFGTWVVAVTFGRIGASGRTLRYVVQDQASAMQVAQACMKRRASAPRRIGTAYQVCEQAGHDLLAVG